MQSHTDGGVMAADGKMLLTGNDIFQTVTVPIGESRRRMQWGVHPIDCGTVMGYMDIFL